MLNKAIKINQIIEPFLADFHNPKSFHVKDQIRINVSNPTETPSWADISSRYSTISSPFMLFQRKNTLKIFL